MVDELVVPEKQTTVRGKALEYIGLIEKWQRTSGSNKPLPPRASNPNLNNWVQRCRSDFRRGTLSVGVRNALHKLGVLPATAGRTPHATFDLDAPGLFHATHTGMPAAMESTYVAGPLLPRHRHEDACANQILALLGPILAFHRHTSRLPTIFSDESGERCLASTLIMIENGVGPDWFFQANRPHLGDEIEAMLKPSTPSGIEKRAAQWRWWSSATLMILRSPKLSPQWRANIWRTSPEALAKLIEVDLAAAKAGRRGWDRGPWGVDRPCILVAISNATKHSSAVHATAGYDSPGALVAGAC